MSAIEIHRPLLSIITINKNNAEGVSRTITSLEPIRHDKTVECIFVDGLSSDESVQIASEFYLPNCLVSERDSGIYQAMNKGLRLASGLWVVWLNSGDEWIPKCWPSLKPLLEGTSASAVCGAAEIIDHKSGVCLGVNDSHISALPWSMVNHSSFIARRETIFKYNGYDESYCIAADRKLLVQMYLRGESFEFTPLCFSRFFTGGISGKRLFSRSMENLRLDRETGLISRSMYYYGVLRHFFYLSIARPLTLVLRRLLSVIGISLPSLGAYVGPLGELKRDAFAQKN